MKCEISCTRPYDMCVWDSDTETVVNMCWKHGRLTYEYMMDLGYTDEEFVWFLRGSADRRTGLPTLPA